MFDRLHVAVWLGYVITVVAFPTGHLKLQSYQEYEKAGENVPVKIGQQRAGSVIPREYWQAAKERYLHRHGYTLNNPVLCSSHPNVFLVIAVRSSYENMANRIAIRETWGAAYHFPKLVVPVIFFMGSSSDPVWQSDIRKENAIYQDVIQEDYIQEESNKATHMIMIYKWLSLFCPNARYIMVTSDNTIVDVFKLVPYLQQEETEYSPKEILLCDLSSCCEKAQSHKPQKRLSKNGLLAYAGDRYPAYCSGSIFVAPYQVIHDMFLVSMETTAFKPTDVWNGVLAEKLDINLLDTSKAFATADTEYALIKKFWTFEYLNRPVLVGVAKNIEADIVPNLVRKVWNVIHIKHKGSRKLSVSEYMGDIQRTRRHLLPVATVAIAADMLAISFVGYIVLKLKIIRFKWR